MVVGHGTEWCFLISAFLIIMAMKPCESMTTSKPETWTGRWLPERTTEAAHDANHNLKDAKHGVKMGVASRFCDDAETNLTVDWNYSPVNYTCFTPKDRYIPDPTSPPLIEKENIPKAYVAQHYCMDKHLEYDRDLPTFGPHRPLWPIYGEYKFVPRQRWLHSLEHGGIVMLYHPCADPSEVEALKQLVKNCLRRHIISPYNLLDSKRPLALLAWGWRMTFSAVQPQIVQRFIKMHALKGPERIATEGQYDALLENMAEVVSDFEDSDLCPNQ
ncbi:uncharacterized protein LOC124624081 [Schistocerca americana]|uniref:uncharacterized protein LOC124624081 n=1 Tax=Schistocerca americana TaxID=7009 RepID=UPI001F503178|nr:uncharacterized protein LOC124624081 [Schistocerca americana]